MLLPFNQMVLVLSTESNQAPSLNTGAVVSGIPLCWNSDTTTCVTLDEVFSFSSSQVSHPKKDIIRESTSEVY